jgi:hypothetical protein
MKKLKLITILLFSGLMVLYNGCKDDECPCDDPTNPVCENYDLNFRKPTADFTMRQSLKPFGWADKPENIAEFCDTIVASNSGVLFTAKEENAIRYEWTIGEDNRTFSTREVALRFDYYLQNPNNIWNPIPVKLKVVKVPDNPHNPADSVYTSERFLVFADEFLWNGTFEGYFDHEPNKKRVISYDFINTKSYNLPKQTFVGCLDSCEVTGVWLDNLLPDKLMRIEWQHTLEKGFPNFFSYKQRKWKADEGDKTANGSFIALSSGVTYFHAYAEPVADGRHKLRLEYKHQTERNGIETPYIFYGTKLK